MARTPKHTDLREACIQEALVIIEATGIESLSLREIARRLGVSHQAPYKHFASRDHVLAEIVSRCFEAFAQYLDDSMHGNDAASDMEAMGRAYFRYALTHPLQYRLMFATSLPNPQQHPTMMNNARHAFAMLHDGITAMRHTQNQPVDAEQTALDALFVWSSVHGLASILQSQALARLALSDKVLEQATDHLLDRITAALDSASDG